MSRIECTRVREIPAFVLASTRWRSRATVEHNDVINILGLHSKHRANHTPIGYVFLVHRHLKEPFVGKTILPYSVFLSYRNLYFANNHTLV